VVLMVLSVLGALSLLSLPERHLPSRPASVLMVPLGVAGEEGSYPDAATLSALSSDLRRSLHCEYAVATPATLPRRFLSAETAQLRVDRALTEVARRYSGKGYFRVLAVTAQDVTVPDYNFLFGLAQSPGLAAIISVHRLSRGADGQRRRERIAKIALHELGHTLGLAHTSDQQSVMVYSNSLPELDAAGRYFTQHEVAMLLRLHPGLAGKVFAHGSGAPAG